MTQLLHRETSLHHFTGDPSRPSALIKKLLPSSLSLIVAPDQYPVSQVAVLQLPPRVIHSPVRTTSQMQIAFLGFAGSTVQRLFKHQVQGVPSGHFMAFCPL